MPVGQGYRIKKSGKQQNKQVKPVIMYYGDPDPKLQYNIPKGVDDDKKIRPKDVFEGFTEKKKPVAKKGKKRKNKRSRPKRGVSTPYYPKESK
tara:strand:+ start:6671 stop:6949 length:279 start_codon:yes stop_codon:yes gene_type:complete